ncbi:class I SAM-dependent methyltransferase [Rhodomicrobium lacus]|uniref:class I SAM-dependent methyltransferase n=1 Tax=Rhodomicrobium lacus TaxID=2498452 RepID=UPI0013DF53EE|nr:methyltransferase domain-containing protein [Rhodomicrobium lacus]
MGRMIKSGDPIFQKYYGDPKYELTLKFYTLVRRYLTPGSRVLNLGAGSGDGTPWGIRRGEATELVGADVDAAVMENKDVDRAILLSGDTLPFDDQTFDLAFSDYVVEHVERPAVFLREVYRVLKPGGAYVFRTPNQYHYVALVARATPHWFHKLVANRMRGLAAEAYEPFPTYYRMNTRGEVHRLAVSCGFSRVDIEMLEGFPAYLMFNSVPFLAGMAYERLVNSSQSLGSLRANIVAVLVR